MTVLFFSFENYYKQSIIDAQVEKRVMWKKIKWILIALIAGTLAYMIFFAGD